MALFSGGLDSSLAIILVQQQGIDVTAVQFFTDFSGNSMVTVKEGKISHPIGEKFGFEIIARYLGDSFHEIIKAPKYGHGKNMNPCIDCRILMLREAKKIMAEIGADFVVTGEVVGQRPKSQYKNSLRAIEKESGLTGYLLRPLSAGLLNETIPEKEGLIKRELLESISGRSRKRQMELAQYYGLEGYQAPGGGCLLTNPQFSGRLRDHLEHGGDFESANIGLLKIGRHFRLNDKVKLIVGRNQKDNNEIRRLTGPQHVLLEVLGAGSPVSLYLGEENRPDLEMAAAITARYSDLKAAARVEVTIFRPSSSEIISVSPADQIQIKVYQIE